MEPRDYTTTDFYTAALLVCLGYPILKVEREGKPDKDGQGKTRRFFFVETDELKKHVLDFMNNKVVGNLRDFRDAIETIKDLVHS